jgi:hypothetical protein
MEDRSFSLFDYARPAVRRIPSNGFKVMPGAAPWRGLAALQFVGEVDNASDRRVQARGHDEATRQSG